LQEAATRVDFYVLNVDDESARLRFACKLIEKVYKLGHNIYACAEDADQQGRFDDLLWNFRDTSFVPHQQQGSDSAAPVTIGCGEPETDGGDVLVNLGAVAPAFFDRFERVIEIVDSSETGRQQGRQRWSQYKAQGLEPETHKID